MLLMWNLLIFKAQCVAVPSDGLNSSQFLRL